MHKCLLFCVPPVAACFTMARSGATPGVARGSWSYERREIDSHASSAPVVPFLQAFAVTIMHRTGTIEAGEEAVCLVR
ncbi:hypothetical protein V8C26DRAFT_417291 [Trichoderma gracile]